MVTAASGGWLVDTSSDLWHVPLSALLMMIVVIAVVRMIGLRSFSKMSSFDFAVTVSVGSILGAVATSSAAVADGAVAVGSLLGVQAVVSWFRARRPAAQKALDNSPLLLMDGPVFLEANLRTARVSRSDVIGKLREANVLRLHDVRAVVLEVTGDISVLHGDNTIDAVILEGVRRGPAIEQIDG